MKYVRISGLSPISNIAEEAEIENIDQLIDVVKKIKEKYGDPYSLSIDVIDDRFVKITECFLKNMDKLNEPLAEAPNPGLIDVISEFYKNNS